MLKMAIYWTTTILVRKWEKMPPPSCRHSWKLIQWSLFQSIPEKSDQLRVQMALKRNSSCTSEFRSYYWQLIKLWLLRFEYVDLLGEKATLLVPSQSVLHGAMDVEVTHKDEKIHLNHYPFLNCLDYVSKYVDITSSMIYLSLFAGSSRFDKTHPGACSEAIWWPTLTDEVNHNWLVNIIN